MQVSRLRAATLLIAALLMAGCHQPTPEKSKPAETKPVAAAAAQPAETARAAATPQTGPAVLHIKADQAKADVSSMLYGLMTEEINFSYDGGIYAELIRNRIFKETGQPRGSSEANAPRIEGAVYWQLVQTGGGTGSATVDANQPMNEALTKSLKLTVTSMAGDQRVGVSNAGFWGIPVRPNTKYRATIWAKGGDGFAGPLTLALVNNDGKAVYAQAKIDKITDQYRKYEATLTTGDLRETKDARFHIWAGSKGTVWFSLVSLFPPTYKDRPNGNRVDLMQLLADMKPRFLRFPGGNYLEGNTLATRFDWKKTIGDISERAGHRCDAWGYWSSDGMGYLEFLEWCEDLDMEPVIGIFAGYTLNRQWVKPGDALKPYVQDALDEIEYTIGDTSTTWGARRAKDGHPKPFKITYVEIGNEEFNAQSEYDARFTQFYDAIKAKYPQLKIIAAIGMPGGAAAGVAVTSRKPDVYDDHFYRDSYGMQTNVTQYDKVDRNGPKIFVGEWATREGSPTPNLGAALSDAAWMIGMERNSDLVIMEAYAPLFVNVNPGGMQWATDLIGYDALNSYGSPAYYAQQMFSTNHGNIVLVTSDENLPARPMPVPRRGGRRGQPAPDANQPPQMRQVPSLFYGATRDGQSGTIYVKVVNVVGTPQPVQIKVSGVARVESSGQLVEMKGAGLTDTNSITERTKIVPVTTRIDGLSTDFTRTFPPYSVSVLVLKTK